MSFLAFKHKLSQNFESIKSIKLIYNKDKATIYINITFTFHLPSIPIYICSSVEVGNIQYTIVWYSSKQEKHPYTKPCSHPLDIVTGHLQLPQQWLANLHKHGFWLATATKWVSSLTSPCINVKWGMNTTDCSDCTPLLFLATIDNLPFTPFPLQYIAISIHSY